MTNNLQKLIENREIGRIKLRIGGVQEIHTDAVLCKDRYVRAKDMGKAIEIINALWEALEPRLKAEQIAGGVE